MFMCSWVYVRRLQLWWFPHRPPPALPPHHPLTHSPRDSNPCDLWRPPGAFKVLGKQLQLFLYQRWFDLMADGEAAANIEKTGTTTVLYCTALHPLVLYCTVNPSAVNFIFCVYHQRCLWVFASLCLCSDAGRCCSTQSRSLMIDDIWNSLESFVSQLFF